MQYTEKLGLNLFEETDPVLADHFNENTQKIENQLIQRPYMVTGTCPSVNGKSLTLTFDHKPLFVILCSGNDSFSCDFCFHGKGKSFVPDGSTESPLAWDDETNSLTITMDTWDFMIYTYTAFLADE